ncbi:alpha-ketoglutarate-dependent dioxygenase AlkB family protein [Pedobacter roseus]|uniref:Alpha-ketoglutarate-dependent dioxygenase AlkB n=1 Tax=Pedobacter roseus TaxID=336820 RepID=A0A7G9QIF6_9SPHI|nr:alpha-ketoglutarate-dependent dioxygenase AlkB [Pedobacter roseus]QNN43131.1 alpha-ketoglutarate-dependent dioxygenase AlkB [Pedobacter roseus]
MAKNNIQTLDLFNTAINTDQNLLPYDGTVNYFAKLFSQQEADHYFDVLMNTVEWKNDEAFIMGKHIITKRKVAWYGDESYSYTYSNKSKTALPWTRELIELKRISEEQTGVTYNSCLLNLYHNGDEGMAYHSDDEKALAKDSAIASLSFGAERRFLFKHKQSKETVTLFLEHGSLLVMKDETQTNWLHRLPPTKKVNQPRINLTFRTMVV